MAQVTRNGQRIRRRFHFGRDATIAVVRARRAAAIAYLADIGETLPPRQRRPPKHRCEKCGGAVYRSHGIIHTTCWNCRKPPSPRCACGKTLLNELSKTTGTCGACRKANQPPKPRPSCEYCGNKMNASTLYATCWRCRAANGETRKRDNERKRSMRAANPEYYQNYERQWRACNKRSMEEWRRRFDAKHSVAPANVIGPWSAAEDAIILRDDLSRLEKAYMLGRSYNQVRGRIRHLRLRESGLTVSQRSYAPWSEEENVILLRDDITTAEKAKLLGRSYTQVLAGRQGLISMSQSRRRLCQCGRGINASPDGSHRSECSVCCRTGR